ncbi:MAG TPA: pirin-like C-terminal cupin domain-containing protein, partial [Gammaproteobacteria bacterium]|nr:pirin-like C-terminal cupin domain-containing protein [Gammaproteobacteria bacterium]
SERTGEADRAGRCALHGTQAWVALPRAVERCEPAFVHVAAARLPECESGGVHIRMLAGAGFGLRSPLPVHSPMHYAEVHCQRGGSFELPCELGQRAAYIVAGSVRCDGQRYEAGQLLVFSDAVPVALNLPSRCHLMLFGGHPLGEDRIIWWNFVATTTAAIDAARQRWARGEFPAVPGDTGSMPMPEF